MPAGARFGTFDDLLRTSMITDALLRRELNFSSTAATELHAGAAAKDAGKGTILSMKSSSTKRLTSK